ncbi:allantoinase PuuE [Salipiger sp. PrR002]|uniref:allantoinase PuuE n=1 Tax=Salipiger sp. PrR002 TaxID=2706489 RepID=UPI0013B6E023|nr:allantoinase PuuE [Salipiger sp. PrR002]NDV98774.1 allantoinase PuuE [Salipiger sp. PrR002]NDW55511.1 allantoinase PuuE [Salipiger sp. PrR004]
MTLLSPLPATRYPRDLTGYGETPPDARWPNGAKIAVQIVVNYEEGGENNVLHGDAASEAFLSEIVGAAQWAGQRHWNMESIYEYGARAGFWRLHRLLKDIPVTVYGVATALARAPEQVAAMKRAGWEIASHGLKWVEHKDMPEEEERAQIREAIRLHTLVTGAPPRGWYTGRCSMNTVRLAAEEGDFAYIADSYADDLPYWSRVAGKDQLIVPYTLDANDMRFASPQGFNSGDQFESYLRDSFDTLYEEGQEGAPKMLSIGLHCRLVGRPGRVAALKRVLAYMASHDGVWFATREQIADHWAAQHPAKAGPRPSEMDRASFTEAFGGVFEHSPWIAEGAHALQLGPTHDSALGVHSVLARVFRDAPDEKRLAVLTAHPDLAGKLAQAKRLTAESTSEQAGAGLDALTDDERAAFTELNETYTAKFGFPFIIAVRDNDKASIMQAFRRRIENDRATEFAEACRQVERIAELRLLDKFGA